MSSLYESKPMLCALNPIPAPQCGTHVPRSRRRRPPAEAYCDFAEFAGLRRETRCSRGHRPGRVHGAAAAAPRRAHRFRRTADRARVRAGSLCNTLT